MNRSKILAAGALFLSLATLPNNASAYSLKHSASGAAVRWYVPSITVRVDPELEQLLPAGQVRAALGMASDAWHGIGDAPEITIADGAPAAYDADKRHNGVYLLRDWPYEPNQLAVTVLTYSTSGQILGIDVLVNGEKHFALLSEEQPATTADAHDFAAVMTHEFGHVLGMDEDHDDETATMWPYIRKGEMHQRTLSDDDERGIVEAYTVQPVAASAAACSATGHIGAGAHGGLFGLALLLAAVVAVSRKRAQA